MVKQIFISHAWGKDGLDRDNHKRCIELYEKLVNNNYSVWIDENEIYGNIDSAIMKGINNAKVILVCLTETYCNKINNAVANNLPNDNCYKEWNYSLFKQKFIIPIVMEPQMKDIYLKHDGIVQMYFNSTLYIDAAEDLDSAINKIIFTLKNNNIYNSKFVNRFKDVKRLDSVFKLLNLKTYFNELIGNKILSKNTKSLNQLISPHPPKSSKPIKFSKSPKSVIQDNISFKDSENNKSINNKSINNKSINNLESDRLSPLNNRVNTFSSSFNNSGRISPFNYSGRLSPINKLITSKRLSPIDQAIQNDMTKNITHNIEKHLKKDIAKEIKKDIKKDIKRDLKKDITKNIQKSLLTGIIINNTINTEDSSELNTSSSDKDSHSLSSESDNDSPKQFNTLKFKNFITDDNNNDNNRPNSAPLPVRYSLNGTNPINKSNTISPILSARGEMSKIKSYAIQSNTHSNNILTSDKLSKSLITL